MAKLFGVSYGAYENAWTGQAFSTREKAEAFVVGDAQRVGEGRGKSVPERSSFDSFEAWRKEANEVLDPHCLDGSVGDIHEMNLDPEVGHYYTTVVL